MDVFRIMVKNLIIRSANSARRRLTRMPASPVSSPGHSALAGNVRREPAQPQPAGGTLCAHRPRQRVTRRRRGWDGM
eukprot:1549264-Prymnesium_polylepis.1